MIFYKIRHKVTGQFSKGGSSVHPDGVYGWAKTGKTWDTLGKLRAHITQHLGLDEYRKPTDMSNWEVIEYHCEPQEPKGIHEIIDPKKLVMLLKR